MASQAPETAGSGGDIDLNSSADGDIAVISDDSLLKEGIGLVGEEGRAKDVTGSNVKFIDGSSVGLKDESFGENAREVVAGGDAAKFDAVEVGDVDALQNYVAVNDSGAVEDRGDAVSGVALGGEGAVHGIEVGGDEKGDFAGGVDSEGVGGADGNVLVVEQETLKKRGRGRPPKSATKKSKYYNNGVDGEIAGKGDLSDTVGSGAAETSGGIVADGFIEVKEEETPKKRPVGRPPKKSGSQKSEDKYVKITAEESSEKRKRGRPRRFASEKHWTRTEKMESLDSSAVKHEHTDLSSEEDDIKVREQKSLLARMGKSREGRSIMVKSSHASYSFAFQDEKKDGYDVSDLVWGKVRSHPWWPGQIFDSSSASKVAMDMQRDGQFLVAYFGDKTFAWCDESNLRHFQTYFPQMEKQNYMESFQNAVDAAVKEASRRVRLAMTCSCHVFEAYNSLLNQKIENSGIKEGTCTSAGDGIWIVNSFSPSEFMDCLYALAELPAGGAGKLEIAMISAQMDAFHCSKGYPERPALFMGGGQTDEDDGSPISKEKSNLHVPDPFSLKTSHSKSREKPKDRARLSLSAKRKNVTPDGRKEKKLSELMKDYSDHPNVRDGDGPGELTSSYSLRQKRKAPDPEFMDLGKTRRKKIDSLRDGKQMQIKPDDETAVKSAAKGKRRRADHVNELPSETEISKAISSLEEYASLNEVILEICLVASDPLYEHSLLKRTVDFLSAFKNWRTTLGKDENHVEVTGTRRGRRKATEFLSTSPESVTKTTGYVQDSYWSDLILSDPEEETISHSLKGKGKYWTTQKKAKRWKPHEEAAITECFDPMSTSPGTKQEQEAEKPLSNLQDVEEYMPTELILTFCGSYVLPGVDDLVKIFGQYGPLREAETEVLANENIARVTFKRRADAETALSSVGQCNLFGQASVGYRLRYLEPSLQKFPDSNIEPKTDDAC